MHLHLLHGPKDGSIVTIPNTEAPAYYDVQEIAKDGAMTWHRYRPQLGPPMPDGSCRYVYVGRLDAIDSIEPFWRRLL